MIYTLIYLQTTSMLKGELQKCILYIFNYKCKFDLVAK